MILVEAQLVLQLPQISLINHNLDSCAICFDLKPTLWGGKSQLPGPIDPRYLASVCVWFTSSLEA